MLKKLFSRLLGRRPPFVSRRVAAARGAPPAFSTPEAAIVTLEDAYRRKDLDACVRAKDFGIEAEYMMWSMSVDAADAALVDETAATLEAAYRAGFALGFPDMEGVVSTFAGTKRVADRVVMVTEVCKYPDGGKSVQRVLVAETEGGWRVLNVVQ